MSDKIQSIGTLWKKEKLATLEWEVNFSELVLEDKDPLPGYYDQFEIPSQEKDLLPRWIFAIIRDTDSFEPDNIIDITNRIKVFYKEPFDAAPGYLTLNNEYVPFIRLQIDNYIILPELLKHYSKLGIEFLPHRKVGIYDSLIKITKFFDLIKISDFIYKDNDLPDTHYIIIPNRLHWDTFEKVTSIVKNNCDHNVYDAALASTYSKTGMIYMVRIYDKKHSVDVLSDIRNKFRNEAERYA